MGRCVFFFFPFFFFSLLNALLAATIDSTKEYCVATVAFTSAEVSHLNCNAGDMITVLDKYPTGWWRGQVGDKSGIFDSNKVQKLSTAEAKKKVEENKGRAPPNAGALPKGMVGRDSGGKKEKKAKRG